MIRLGLDTWLWASTFNRIHLYCIDEAKKLGAEVIDFSINDPFCFPTKEAAELVKQNEIEVVTSTALPINCNPISPDKSVRSSALNFMKKLVDITAQLGGRVTGGVNYAASGYLTGKLRTQQEIQWSVEHLRAVAEYASQYDIVVAVEPVKRFESHFLNTAEQALELIKLADMPNIKIHLDTFHMNIEERSLHDAIISCGDKLVHMHLADSNRGVPGMGHIQWIDVFNALKQINYSGTACIETFNPETLEETCKLTYLTRKFASTPEELASRGLRYLRAVETIVYD
jgi:D-psicose/D-tagatose/L-ribulose 3-epimerase